MSDQTIEQGAFRQWCEEWRPVVGYEGIYEVSSLGQVRRVGPAARHGAGHGGGVRIGRIRQPQTVRGYLVVLLWKEGRYQPFLVHRLAAAAFLGPLPDGYEINHRDGDKTNNRPENLEYVTRSANMLHAYRTGLRPEANLPTGEAHPNAKLTAADVDKIRRLYQPRVYGTPRLAKEFGVSHKTIHAIISGKNWKRLEATA